MPITDPRIERVRAARKAVGAAEAAEEQAIRDAYDAGATPTSIARKGLDTKGTQRVYAILGRGQDGGDPQPPALTPMVYLRGARCTDDEWTRVEQAMWARGWATTRDRTTAWHAARGGVPVVMCDFSMDLDHPTSAPGGGLLVGYNRYVLVGRVRARYQESPTVTTVGSLLPTPEYARLVRAGAEWANIQVETTTTDLDLRLISGGETPRDELQGSPLRQMDEHALARLVADALA